MTKAKRRLSYEVATVPITIRVSPETERALQILERFYSGPLNTRTLVVRDLLTRAIVEHPLWPEIKARLIKEGNWYFADD